MRELLGNVKITRVMLNGAGTASASPTKADVILDMAGFHSVLFLAVMADVVNLSVVSLRAAQSNTNSTGTMALLTGSAGGTAGTSTYDDKIIALELVKPTKRYIEAQMFHVTQDAPFDCVIAIQYGARTAPTTHDSTVVATASLVSPLEA